ncbi:MAG: helix-turn-helix domain-containing protein [Pseudoruegeria sp.]
MPTEKRKLNHNCPTRDVLNRLTDSWSLLILMELDHGELRFNRLREAVDGISQRMLTVTLRNLERDGLVNRAVYPSAPPRVEYALTELGQSLVFPLRPLKDWATRCQPDVRAARARYDQQTSAH